MINESQTKIRISIAEPWNFEIPGRGNQFSGVVKGFCLPPQSKNWGDGYLLVDIENGFGWNGENISQILITARHTNDTINSIYAGKELTIGIARVRPGYLIKAGDSFTPEQIEYFAIGAAQRIDSAE